MYRGATQVSTEISSVHLKELSGVQGARVRPGTGRREPTLRKNNREERRDPRGALTFSPVSPTGARSQGPGLCHPPATRAPVTPSGGMTPSRGHGHWGSVRGPRRAVVFAPLLVPAAARRPGGATLGQRPRHPSGYPRRNRDGTRGTPALPTTPALRATPKGTGSLSTASGPPPRRDARPAGVPRREGRAGGRPTAGRGEPDQQRSRPDRAHLQVVLRKVLAQPRYLHILVQV